MIFTKRKKKTADVAPNTNDSPQTLREGNLARVICDENGQILHANDAFFALMNVQDIPKKHPLLNFISFHDVDIHAYGFQGVYAGDYRIRLNHTMQDIVLRFDWVQNADGRKMLIGAGIGEVEETQSHLSPITAQPQTHTAHQNNNIVHYDETPRVDAEHDLSAFLDMSHEVLCTVALNGAFGWMNDTFCSLFKTDSSALNGRGFLDIVHLHERNLVRQVIQDLQDNPTATFSDFECCMIAGDGDVLYLQWRIKKSGDAFYCVGQDLTAIKLHEDMLRRQETKLLEAEAIGRMGHWHWKLGEDFFSWSDEIYRIFGVTKDDFVPSIDTVNQMVHRSDSGRIMQVFQRAMIENKDYEMDLRIERPDGGICYVRCQGRCESDVDGDVLGLYGIMQDITQDTIREQDLREAKDAAESAYAAKSRFLANMSHELRTPLNAIIGFSEMIQNQLLGPIGNERYIEYVGGIRESGEHLLDLISDILDMSKIEAGKYELVLENFTLSKVIRMALHMMEGRAVDSSIKLTCEIADEEQKIVADRRAIMQIMLNLLSNAVKFSPQGGEITTTCRFEDDFAYIDVSDNGIGIPKHQLQTIMRPFEQVSSHYTREHEGSGLGLAITKELIEMHGGKVNIESQLDVGTTVHIKIPLRART